MDLRSMIVCNINKDKICDLIDSTPQCAFNIIEGFKANEVTTLTFDYPIVNNGKWINLINENLILFNGEYYVIKKPNFVHDADNKLYVHCECRHLSCRLSEQLISINEIEPTNITELMKIALLYDENGVSQTGWEVGEVNVDKVAVRGLEANEQSPFSILLTIMDKYSAIPIFDSINMVVNVIPIEDTEHPTIDLRVSKNMQSMEVSYDTSEMVTRLYCYGTTDDDGHDLDIMSVNPTEQAYIDNFDYFYKIGYTEKFVKEHPSLFVKTNIWRDDSYFLAQDLYDDGVKELDKIAKPIVNVKVVALNTKEVRNSNEFKQLKVGDCIRVYDEDLGFDTLCNVTSRTIEYENEHILNIEITNSIVYRDTLSELFNSVSNASSVVTSGGKVIGGKVDNIDVTQIKNLDVYYLTAEEIIAKYIDAETLRATYASIEYLKANYIDAVSISAQFATIGKLEALEAKIKDLNVDVLNAKIAEIEKAIIEYAEIGKIVATEAEIEDLKANNITVAGKITATDAELENVKATYLQVGNFEAYKATIEQLFALYATIEHLEAEYIKASKIEADYAKIADLTVTNATIETLKANLISVEELVAEKATITDLNAVKADIQSLNAELATINTAIIDIAHIGDLNALKATIEDLVAENINAVNANIDSIKANYVTTSVLNAKVATINDLIAKKATIEDLNATNADIGKLDAGLANIETIVSGNVGTGLLQTLRLTAKNVVIDDAIIKSAMIQDLDVSKLKAGTISTDKFTIKSNDGGMQIVGSTQQFYDKNGKVRLQIGKDALGNFNFIVIGEDGTTTLYDQDGIKAGAIPDKIIVNDMVADNANISGSKLERESLIDKINADGSKTISSSKVWIDEENQSLGVSFKEVKDSVVGTTEDLGAYISATNKTLQGMQGQIDGSIMSWFYEYVPTDINIPAKDWDTVSLKNNHLGDLFYNTLTGYCYRYQVKNNIYSWQRITDTDITKALEEASKAQDTADSKRRVFTTTPTAPYDIGDLWAQGASGELMRCKAKKIEGQTYASIDWGKASKYTDDTKANAVDGKVNTLQTEFKVEQGKITSLIKETESITKRVTETEKVADSANSKIDNLEIGGRNLLIGTEVPYNLASSDYPTVSKREQGKITTLSSGFGNAYAKISNNLIIPPSNINNYVGEPMGIAIDVKVTGDFTSLRCEFDYRGGASNSLFITAHVPIGYPKNKWFRIYGSSKILNFTATSSIINITWNGSTVGSTVEYRLPKLEFGNKPSTWTPAIEDMEKTVTTLTDRYNETVKTVEGNTTTIGNVKTSVSDLSGKVVALDSKMLEIKQTADGVSTTVTASKGKWDTASTNADKALKPYAYSKVVDLTATTYDQNTFYSIYPMERLSVSDYTRLAVVTTLDGAKPAWSNHASGFTCLLELRVRGSGWGVTNGDGWIDTNTYSFCDQMPAYFIQNYMASTPIFYLRGGGRYTLKHSLDFNWVVSTNGYHWESGTTKYDAPPIKLPNKPINNSTLEDNTKNAKDIHETKTTATQTAEKFTWLVKSGTSSTNFVLTDRTATLVSEQINLKGMVTFSGLGSDAQGKINTATSTASTAKSTADTAKSTADTAKSTATTAQSTATTAQNTANTANSNANTALKKLTLSEQTIMNGVELFDRRYETDMSSSPFVDGAHSIVPATTISGGVGSEYNLIKSVNGVFLFTNLIPWNFNSNPFYFSCEVYYPSTTNGVVYVQVGFYDENKNFIGDNAGFNVNLVSNASVTTANKWHTFVYKTDTLLSTNAMRSRAKYIRLRYLPRYSGQIGEAYIRNITWKQLSPSGVGSMLSDTSSWTADIPPHGTTTINGGVIKTQSITSQQLKVDEILANNGTFLGIIRAQDLDANKITAGLLSANRISAYGLKVYQKNASGVQTTTETFSISEKGEVTVRGSVESYNYGTGRSGWSIKSSGDAEFNDVTVRGSLITNDGGIVTSGGAGRNFAINTLLKTMTSWTNHSANKQYKLVEGYNGCGGIEFTTGATGNCGLYQYPPIVSPNLPIGTYTLSAWIFPKKAGTHIFGFNISGNKLETNGLKLNEWQYVSVTFTTTALITKPPFYFVSSGFEGIISCIKFEKGSTSTPWSPAPEDNIKQVSFWAGSTYENRDSAPFIVYNDGSMVAQKGSFSGVFTGDVKIGNISIVDPSDKSGNDANFTMLNGQSGIKVVQLRDGEESSFAQDVVVTDNFYNKTITLAQDGSIVSNNQLSVINGSNNSALTSTGLTINKVSLNGSNGILNVVANTNNFGSSTSKTDVNVYGDLLVTDTMQVNGVQKYGKVVEVVVTTNGIDWNVLV